MSPADRNINIDKDSDDELDKVLFSVLVIGLLCVIGLVRGCA